MADTTVNVNGTIANDAVSNAKLANMAEARVKMRAVGAGTGDPIDGTADQLSTLLDAATDPFLRTSDYDPTPPLAASQITDDSNVGQVNLALALNALLTTDGNHDNSISQLITAVNGKAEASHTHTIGDVTGLQTAIDGKAASSHTHAISEVTGLQTALDGKAATSHTHTLSQITDAGAGANLDRLQVTVGSGQTTSSTTPVDITGCSLVLPANKTGSVTIRVLASNSSTSGGIGVTLNGSTAADYVSGRLDGHQSAGNYPVANITAFDGGTAAATVAIANTVYFYTANFDVVAGASPITLTARIFRGGSAGTITIRSARMTIQY